eukprot:6074188-Pleurochrysis_carterae.AAC.1
MRRRCPPRRCPQGHGTCRAAPPAPSSRSARLLPPSSPSLNPIAPHGACRRTCWRGSPPTTAGAPPAA